MIWLDVKIPFSVSGGLRVASYELRVASCDWSLPIREALSVHLD
jgi:hypothetical protein